MFSTQYRIARDSWFSDYWAVQRRTWWWPFWVEVGNGLLESKEAASELITLLRERR